MPSIDFGSIYTLFYLVVGYVAGALAQNDFFGWGKGA